MRALSSSDGRSGGAWFGGPPPPIDMLVTIRVGGLDMEGTSLPYADRAEMSPACAESRQSSLTHYKSLGVHCRGQGSKFLSRTTSLSLSCTRPQTLIQRRTRNGCPRVHSSPNN